MARAHGFRKFFTAQLINSKVNSEIRELLLGHKIGLASCYYRPTEKEMLDEYMKAVNHLTINEENRLKFKLEEHIQIRKTEMETMQKQMDEFHKELQAMQKKQKKK